jgi:hypothetical protein
VADKHVLSEAANKALREVEKSNKFHDDLVTRVERCWEDYEGILRDSSEAADWESQLHPPYVHHIVETAVSALLEDKFAFKIRPAPRLFNPGEYESAVKGAKAHEILFKAQLKADRFNEFQRPFVLQAAVCPLSVAKTFWKEEVAPRKKRVPVDVAPPGFPFPLWKMEVQERPERVFDGPVTEAVDIRDFYWEEAATSLENSRWAAHALWMSKEDILALAKAGKYDMEAAKALVEGSPDGETGGSEVERQREQRSRKKGRWEVLEIYDRVDRKFYVIGGRKVELRKRGWPFWHGEFPFTVCSLQPFPFSLQSKTVVERLAHLQEATWDLMNQRHTNLSFLNNAIQMVTPEQLLMNELEYAPGAQWVMENPAAAVMWQPNPLPAEISIPAEGMLKADMQNMSGGHPFTSTSEAKNVGADTATEAALVSNLAQRATLATKSQLNYAYSRIGCQRMYLNQQFVLEPIYVETVGMDSLPETAEILPHMLGGEYLFDISPMSESMYRAERRAEGNAKFQLFIQAAPVLAALGVQMNYKKFAEDVLESYDTENVEEYFSAQPPPQGVEQAGAPQGAPQGGPGPDAPPVGVTSPLATNATTSPSNQGSVSPEAMMQRMMAARGGQNNLG